MKLTKDQIKIIEKTADELKLQANNLSYSSPCATIIQFPPTWCYKKEILLLLMKTNIGDKVEKDFAEIDKLQQEYESWRGKVITENNQEDFTLLIDCLKGAFYELSGTLHQIAQFAKTDKKKEIIIGLLKVIGAIVGFLAAIFTCIYSLWWLWTTFWKK